MYLCEMLKPGRKRKSIIKRKKLCKIMVCKSVLKTEDLEIHIDTFVQHCIYFFGFDFWCNQQSYNKNISF